MKKQYFLILLTTSFALFGAENNNCQKHTQEIARLKEQHALEIALYEKKLEVMLAERDYQTAALRAERESAQHAKTKHSPTHNQEAVCVIPSVWTMEDKNSKK